MRFFSLAFCLSLFVGSVAWAQAPTIDIDLTANGVLSQGQTGTCWSFSTTSYLESEAFRLTGDLHDLSEMAAVRINYPHKAELFIRYQGKHQFGPGGLSHDVISAASEYGLVPQSVYAGGQDPAAYNHNELDAMLEGMVQNIIEQSGSISPAAWTSLESVLDAYLGPLPDEFEYRGKKYSPASFRDACGVDPANYVTLTSYTHHPFGEPFILEIPDNYAQGLFWNVPLDDLEETVHYALEKGMTVAWDADVSNSGFSFRNGWAVMPGVAASSEEWKTLDSMPLEKAVDQTYRQAAFDSQENTDDHLMHIVGRATDAQGRRYFIIKNSWGDGNAYGGRQFLSMDYFRHHTVGIMLHRDGLIKSVSKLMR